jgi:hypothetical protein
MKFRTIVSVAIILAHSLFVVRVASAHNMTPRVEISLERLHPGEVVDVRGVSFEMDEPVTLTLLGSGVEIPLGEILSSGEGEFLYIAALPTDLAEGSYYFRATTSHHWVISPPLTVWGTAVEEGGGQGPRDEDDGLLAPMPTAAPALATMPAPVVSAPVESSAVSSRWITNILILVALMVVVAALLLMLGRKRTA